jgi:hypothetical protein
MDANHQPDCHVIYREGCAALASGDAQSGFKLFRVALKAGLDGASGVVAGATCCTVLYEQHLDDEAREMGEYALVLDRRIKLDVGDLEDSELEEDVIEREHLLVRLDILWGRAADTIEEAQGPRAAYQYLMKKLGLVEYLPEYSLPGVYFRLGEYIADFGKSEDADVQYRRVIDSKLTSIDDEAIHRHYAMFRAMAKIELEKSEPRSSKPDCWVATVLYGQSSEEIRLLRWFRDSVLSNSTLGRLSVSCYYHTGPLMAICMRRCPPLGTILRVMLVAPTLAISKRRFTRIRRGEHGYSLRCRCKETNLSAMAVAPGG